MQSDLELRAWPAEHLGGYERVGRFHFAGDAPSLWGYRSGRGPDPVPAYEASWEGLGLVVEAMRARGWEVLIDCNGMWQDVPDGDDLVNIFDRVDHALMGRAHHPCTPMAAARAARAAIEAENSLDRPEAP